MGQSQSFSGNVRSSNKYERYQSPIVKLNQGGITAKQGQGVITTTNTATGNATQNQMSSSTGMPQSSTSAGRLMQNSVSASGSLKIQSKGSKQMNQFRYGPVRAVQQTMPHSYSSGISNLKQNVLSQQRRSGAAGLNTGNQGTKGGTSSLLSGSQQKQRPNSSKPIGDSSAGNTSILNISGQQDRSLNAGQARPSSPGISSGLSKCALSCFC